MGNYDFSLDLDSINTMSIINNWIECDKKVLEFGPANGRLTKYLNETKKCEVTIVEIDEESGRMASQYSTKSYIGHEEGNIENYYWNTSDVKYDYIIFADVLEHLSDPETVLKKCKDILNENGRILVSIPNISHNSVIIDLLNDKFNYQKAGLLNKTHIHFFTYNTFTTMLKSCDLYVHSMEPIYSRVGDNEIDATYNDIPTEIGKYLRKRKTGSVYQYVWNLALKSDLQQKGLVQECVPLLIDEYEKLETQIFYKDCKDNAYSESNRIGHIYSENEQVIFDVEYSDLNGAKMLRWDPLEFSGILQVEEVFIVNRDESHKKLDVFACNAKYIYGNIYIFDVEDPWLEYQIEDDTDIKQIHIKFRVLIYRLNEKDSANRSTALLDMFSENGVQSELNELKREVQLKEEENRYLIQSVNKKDTDIIELKKVLEARDKDIVFLNKEIQNRDNVLLQYQDEKEKKEILLEETIERLNHQLENLTRTQQDYMQHLETLEEEYRLQQEEKEEIEKSYKKSKVFEELYQKTFKYRIEKLNQKIRGEGKV